MVRRRPSSICPRPHSGASGPRARILQPGRLTKWPASPLGALVRNDHRNVGEDFPRPRPPADGGRTRGAARRCGPGGVTVNGPTTKRWSVQLEGRLVVLLERRILLRLTQVAIAHREHVEFRPHEAAERVFWRAHDRLAAHVEARVHEHRTAGTPLELD